MCIILYQSCSNWFRNKNGVISISELEDYASAQVDKYFWVLLIIALLGVIINVLPSIRSFVDSIEEKATESIKTPVITKPTPKHRRVLSADLDSDDEESTPMLRVKRHQAYLKYGSGPVLYKQGSMRAGPSVGKAKPKKNIKKSQVGKLYKTKSSRTATRVVMGADGTPMKAGSMYKRQESL